MATIRLQLIKGFFYPTDAASRKILEDSLRVDRIPLERIDVVSPKLVKAGHAWLSQAGTHHLFPCAFRLFCRKKFTALLNPLKERIEYVSKQCLSDGD